MMQVVNTSARYGAVSQGLHWMIAVLVAVLILTGKVGDVDAKEQNASYFWHSSLGISVLALVIVRAAWRLINRQPLPVESMSRLAGHVAKTLHAIFYVLLLALPLSGGLTASGEGAPITFFGAVTIPSWSMVNENEMFEEAHELLGNLLLALVVLHAAAALKHHFIDKDEVLLRMLPRKSVLPDKAAGN